MSDVVCVYCGQTVREQEERWIIRYGVDAEDELGIEGGVMHYACMKVMDRTSFITLTEALHE